MGNERTNIMREIISADVEIIDAEIIEEVKTSNCKNGSEDRTGTAKAENKTAGVLRYIRELIWEHKFKYLCMVAVMYAYMAIDWRGMADTALRVGKYAFVAQKVLPFMQGAVTGAAGSKILKDSNRSQALKWKLDELKNGKILKAKAPVRTTFKGYVNKSSAAAKMTIANKIKSMNGLKEGVKEGAKLGGIISAGVETITSGYEVYTGDKTMGEAGASVVEAGFVGAAAAGAGAAVAAVIGGGFIASTAAFVGTGILVEKTYQFGKEMLLGN